MLLPTVPLYARRLGIGESQIGVIVGFFALSAMVVRPWAGWAADRYGRLPLLAAGASIFLVSPLLYAWSQSAGALLLARLVHGTGMGCFPTSATAVVADIAPPDRRGEAMGLFGVASNLALAVGPFVGFWVAERAGFPPLFLASSAIAAVALGLALSLPETVPERRRDPFVVRAALSRAAVLPSAIAFCLMTTYGVLAAFLPLYVQKLETGNPGTFFVVFALSAAAVRGYAGRLSDRRGRAPVTVVGTLLVSLAMAVLAGSGTLPALLLAGVLYGLGFGTTQPVLMAWTADLVPPAERGKAMGTFFTGLELGIALGAAGFGLVLARLGFPLTFLAAGALALAGGALAVTRLGR